MPVLSIHRPVTTREPTLTVDNELASGEHRFQLQVVRSDGRASAVDIATVMVSRPIPTPPTDDRIPRRP